MKTNITLTALLVCVLSSVALAQRPTTLVNNDAAMMVRPDTMMIPPVGLIEPPAVGPELTHSEYLGLTVESHDERGLKVYQTTMDGAAATIGLEHGDIVLGAEGYYVDTMEQLENAMRRNRGRLEVTVINVRNGRRVNAVMTLPNTTILVDPVSYVPGLGVEVEMRRGGGYKITRIDRTGVAKKISLTVGDVLLKINGQKVEDVRDPSLVYSKSFTLVYEDVETGYTYTLNRRVWTP